MFKFLGKVFKRTAHECMQHDHTKFPNIIANEYCRSCEQDICYMCGNDHINNHHPVKVSRNSILQKPDSLIVKDVNILKEFNTGSLIHLDINKLKCICGKPANEHTAICAACGSATCSSECHHELEKQDKCKFHHNFTENAKNKSLRSILIKNAYFLYDKGYSQGTVFSRTSQHFISAFLTSQRHAIYLQRGYRQYGNPDASTLNAMDIVKGADLDREVHLMRVCQCKCAYCSQIGHHPVHLCSGYCKAKDLFIMRSYAQENPSEKDEPCSCKCTFCTSGHTVLVHKKVDCCLKCEFRSKVDF